MPRTKLTKRVIDELEPGPKDAFYWDSDITGLGLKVTPKGRKTFLIQYRARRTEIAHPKGLSRPIRNRHPSQGAEGSLANPWIARRGPRSGVRATTSPPPRRVRSIL